MRSEGRCGNDWIPAFAGMTEKTRELHNPSPRFFAALRMTKEPLRITKEAFKMTGSAQNDRGYRTTGRRLTLRGAPRNDS
jgi:hypothetical protein